MIKAPVPKDKVWRDQKTEGQLLSAPRVHWFSSVEGGIYVLGKAHMRSTPSLRSFPNVAFETVPTDQFLGVLRPAQQYGHIRANSGK